MSQRFRRALHLSLPLLLLAASLVLADCTRKPVPPAREITSMHMTGVYAEAARTLAGEFEKQTGIRVKVVSAPYLALREKQLTAVLNGSSQYDVMQIAQQWSEEFAEHLQPLSPYLGSDGPRLESFIETLVSSATPEVRYLPLSCDAITLLYRKDLFAAKAPEFQHLTGRELRPPRTWDEYLEVARFFNNEPLYGNIIMGLKEQNFTVWSGIFFGLGGQLVDERWRPNLNSDIGVRSLSIFAEMFHYAPPGSQRLGSEEANALFLQGKGAMYLTWPSLIWSQMNDTNLCRIAGRIGAAPIPGGVPQVSSWSLGINAHSNDKGAAFRWIQFFLSESNTRRLLLEYGKGSPLKATYERSDIRRAVFYLPEVFQGLKQGKPRFTIPASQEMCDYLDYQIAETVAGHIAPRTALDRTAAHWREILQRGGFLPASRDGK